MEKGKSKDKIAIIADVKIPPNYYPLFNAKTMDMFKHEFKSLSKNDQKWAVAIYEQTLKNKKAVLVEMKGMLND